jgi:hypothetical protein
MLKIDSWPQAIVLVTGILGLVGLVAFLSAAGWSEGGIAGMVTLLLAVVTGQYMNARKASVVEAKTDAQTDQLTQIAKQTNGLSGTERQEIAERAVDAVLARQAAQTKRSIL